MGCLGAEGWPEEAPFDAVIVTCAAEEVPPALLDQLQPEGRMVIPVGAQGALQELYLYLKDEHGGIEREKLGGVRFVPFV